MLQPPPGPALPGALGSNLGAFQPKVSKVCGLLIPILTNIYYNCLGPTLIEHNLN